MSTWSDLVNETAPRRLLPHPPPPHLSPPSHQPSYKSSGMRYQKLGSHQKTKLVSMLLPSLLLRSVLQNWFLLRCNASGY
ncbi:hypothetical protein RRG08_025594 [Elysia crispata]|uniref:Uncharacterized protein n=1 Tax=Elysia crispata TaxID=231223 RepID=A0AAE0YEC7_9GAST|nr:hypothetical protein RRG08_025594 [Elysia crispata]